MNMQDHTHLLVAEAAGAADGSGGDGPAPLTPCGELCIYTVAEMRPRWLAWVAEWADADTHPAGAAAGASPQGTAAAPTLSAAAIDNVDAAGVQLLLALDHALGQRGQRLRIQDASPSLQRGCSAMGLGDWLHARIGDDLAMA
jgi:hypothetical protein